MDNRLVFVFLSYVRLTITRLRGSPGSRFPSRCEKKDLKERERIKKRKKMRKKRRKKGGKNEKKKRGKERQANS